MSTSNGGMSAIRSPLETFAPTVARGARHAYAQGSPRAAALCRCGGDHILNKAFSPNLLAKVKSRAQYQNIVSAPDTGISGRKVCRSFGYLKARRMFAFRHNDRKRGAASN